LKESFPITSVADIDKKTVSGNYGIDSLFVKKSRKLSLIEFCDGLKDIFLAIPIFSFKVAAAVFNFAKRPICALGITCAAVLTIVAHAFKGGGEVPQSVAAEVAVAVGQKTRIISDIDEHIAAHQGDENGSPLKIVSEKAKNGKEVTGADHGKSVLAFEGNLRDFFAEHAISDVTCANGRCRLKLQDGIFSEHSIICDRPKIVLESSTDDEIVFSDGAGTFCALTIESLLH
jgi:hypothetical protein